MLLSSSPPAALLERFVVVRLQRNFLHGHDVPGLVVDGSVDLAEVSLSCVTAP